MGRTIVAHEQSARRSTR